MKIGTATMNEGMVFGYDTGKGSFSKDSNNLYFKGRPTTNYITNASQMSGWGSYSAGNDGTFTTEFGTIGYKMVKRNSWNGLFKDFTLPSTGTYTFSAWYRYWGGTSSNNGATCYVSGYGGGDTASSINKGIIGKWQRIERTVNVTDVTVRFYLISYGGSSSTDWSSWDVTMPQIEKQSDRTPFVDGSRGNTTSLYDFDRSTTLDVGNLSFDSNGFPYFDGTNDRIYQSWPSKYNVDDSTTPRSWEAIFKPDVTGGYRGIFGHKISSGCSYFCNGGIYIYNNAITFNWYDNAAYRFIGNITANSGNYYHVVGTFDTDRKPRLYVNGSLNATYSSATNLDYSGGMGILDIGWNSKNGGQHYFAGDIPVTKFYKSKALSAAEVQQNYLAYRKRFNIT